MVSILGFDLGNKSPPIKEQHVEQPKLEQLVVPHSGVPPADRIFDLTEEYLPLFGQHLYRLLGHGDKLIDRWYKPSDKWIPDEKTNPVVFNGTEKLGDRVHLKFGGNGFHCFSFDLKGSPRFAFLENEYGQINGLWVSTGNAPMTPYSFDAPNPWSVRYVSIYIPQSR